MTGFRLGQAYGFGRTQQSTIQPGTAEMPPPPAAGAGYTLPLQRYDRWRLIGVAFDLVTSNHAANRFVQVQYPDGTGVVTVRDLAGYPQPASKTVHYSGALDGLAIVEASTDASVGFRLSGHWLEVGRSVVLAVVNIDANDQLSNIRLTFDRTLVHDDGSERIREREAEQELDQELAEASGG